MYNIGGKNMIYPKRDEIKKRREDLGLTRCALSRKAGLPHNAIYRIEEGHFRSTYPIRARAIAEALGCSLEDVFICD